ncbi:MAG: FkbM family methyltransferase [Magnetococcales bacterium]|nr:FkbM family methyltransferase [Magnetococcales bacterium]
MEALSREESLIFVISQLNAGVSVGDIQAVSAQRGIGTDIVNTCVYLVKYMRSVTDSGVSPDHLKQALIERGVSVKVAEAACNTYTKSRSTIETNTKLQERLKPLLDSAIGFFIAGIPAPDVVNVLIEPLQNERKQMTKMLLLYLAESMELLLSMLRLGRGVEEIRSAVETIGRNKWQVDGHDWLLNHMMDSTLAQYKLGPERGFLKYIYLLTFQDMYRAIPENPTEIEHRKEVLVPGWRKASAENALSHAHWLEWVVDNHENLCHAWQQYANLQSKSLFIDLLRYRIAGPTHVRLPTDSPGYWQLWDRMQKEVANDEELQQSSAVTIYPVKYYKFMFQERLVRIHCHFIDIFFAFYMSQYFYNRGGVSIQPEAGDYAVDAGTYTGETTLRFALAVGAQGCVYSFDPVQDHIRLVKRNLEINALDNAVLFNYGLSDVDYEAPPVSIGAMDSGFRISSGDIPLASIDGLVAKGTIKRVDFLKLDVEGVELKALQGAESTIRQFRPKLAISIYHKPEDLYVLAEWIKGLGLGYHLFLDHYTTLEWETILYATVDYTPQP